MKKDNKNILDSGLSDKTASNQQRILLRSGTYNVIRKGKKIGLGDAYQFFISLSWPKLIGLVFLGFVFVNILFALLYMAIGVEHLSGIPKQSKWEDFLSCFYFSCQTYTTVGYGGISPSGHLTSSLSAFESLFGLLSFSLATGIIFGRFSKPIAKVAYSENILVAPYGKNNVEYGLMFRMVNQRDTLLSNARIHVMYSMDILENGSYKRIYKALNLEIDRIKMFPLTWTVVHPIDENSVFYGLTQEDLQKQKVEIMVMTEAFDEKFNDVVHSRTSYIPKDFVFGAKFLPAQQVNSDGIMEIDLEKIGEFEIV
ncbi:MAG: hypothetical protein C4K58_02980 [Flavobacteriaceae bacterium]|nr:MAG: hypothetical protein C4K58_02980 [Flavobacteriaceae bacterium]